MSRSPGGRRGSVASAVAALTAWYRAEGRELPWRSDPTPYRVWVSEVMLQQTQVTTVVPYFDRWMRRFPDLRALAAATEGDVLAAWQGLGYYGRARALHATARHLVAERGGAMPATAPALRGLPGVGRYTAGAIASIAFGEREPVVDGNVARVLARWHRLRGDPRREPLRGRLWSLAAELVEHDHPGDVNQALMELGAVVCTPRAPRCGDCPLATRCEAHAAGVAERYPERAPAPAPRRVVMAASVVSRAGRLLVVRAPTRARWWAGLWHFPFAEVEGAEAPAAAAARAAVGELGRRVPEGLPLLRLRHVVTRHRVTLHVLGFRLAPGASGGVRRRGRAWRRPAELMELAMPAPHREVVLELARRAGALGPMDAARRR